MKVVDSATDVYNALAILDADSLRRLADVLSDWNFNPNQLNAQNLSPLLAGIMRGEKKHIEMLIKKGCSATLEEHEIVERQFPEKRALVENEFNSMKSRLILYSTLKEIDGLGI